MFRTVALLALFACTCAQAEITQCTPISGVPVTISAAGTYCLTTDLYVGSGTAITIQADNVVLDLNGHALAGPGGSSSTGIYSNLHRGLRIRNGTVRNFSSGVLIDDHASP